MCITACIVGCGCGGPANVASGPRLVLELPSAGGERINVADYRGRVLIVHVFTTWSMPAKDDAIHLEDAFARDERVVVLGVVLDPEAPRLIDAWRRGMDVTYPIAFADARIRNGDSALGDASAVPFTVVFNREGRELHRIATPLGDAGIDEIRRRAALGAR